MNFPMAWAASVLAWGFIEFQDVSGSYQKIRFIWHAGTPFPYCLQLLAYTWHCKFACQYPLLCTM